MSRPWPTEEEALLARCRIFDVVRARRRSPKDRSAHDFYIVRAPDWANVIALTDADEALLVEQWRHGTGRVTLEIPGGLVDPGETPARAAARELIEETGYVPGRLLELGVSEPNPAFMDNRCTTFLALGCRPWAGEARAPHADATEECLLRIEPYARVRTLAAAGEINHAIVLAALHLEEQRRAGRLEPRPIPEAEWGSGG